MVLVSVNAKRKGKRRKEKNVHLVRLVTDGFLRKREGERLVNRFRGGDSGGGDKGDGDGRGDVV